MGDEPRIILLAFDGFPRRAFGRKTTPNLWRLAQEGGYSPDGGRASLPATTYPGFACLLTGAGQWKTGVRTTSRKVGAVPGWAGTDRTRLPTIVHAGEAAGMKAIAVMGDRRLQRVLRLNDLEGTWTPAMLPPSVTELGSFGYPSNAAVRPLALSAAADPSVDFLFVHFTETGTLSLAHGPNSVQAIESVRAADEIVGELLERIDSDWDRTVLAVVSDHDIAERLSYPAIDPTASLDCAGLVDDWIADGCAAWLSVSAGADAHMAISRLVALNGVESWRWRAPNTLLLLAAPGRTFAAPWIPLHGLHGSADTAKTLAIVGGGHPSVRRIGASIGARPPHLTDWAPTLAGILGVDLREAEGLNLTGSAALQQVG